MADAGQSHLSIGEVLGLLLEEFPDVTISKIRFLESQGLIEPERTPSGYRKFFDDDVVLLRLILREQREKFLPLRVIKDRIDSGEIEPPPDAPSAADDGREKPTKAAIAKHPAARRPSSASVPSSGSSPSASKSPPPVGTTASPATATEAAAPSGIDPERCDDGAADRPGRAVRPVRPAERPTQAAASRGAVGRHVASWRAGEPRGAVRDGVGHTRTARPARGLRRRLAPRRGRRSLRGRGGRDRRGRRRLLARRCRCPPPAGVADVRRTRIRPVRAADPAPVAAAQPPGAGSSSRPAWRSSTGSGPSCGRR